MLCVCCCDSCVLNRLFSVLSVQHDDEEMTEDGDGGWRRNSISSDSSISTVIMDAAMISETNDLAAQVGGWS